MRQLISTILGTSTKRYYIGIDGGGTKTITSLADDTSEIGMKHLDCALIVSWLATHLSGPSNWNSVGDELSLEALRSGINQVLTVAQITPEQGMRTDRNFSLRDCSRAVSAVCVGMAGVDRPEDITKAHSFLDQIFPQEPRPKYYVWTTKWLIEIFFFFFPVLEWFN